MSLDTAFEEQLFCFHIPYLIKIVSLCLSKIKTDNLRLFNKYLFSFLLIKASHGFITQHPWASLIRAFINLEAAGVGGKELVFQTGM